MNENRLGKLSERNSIEDHIHTGIQKPGSHVVGDLCKRTLLETRGLPRVAEALEVQNSVSDLWKKDWNENNFLLTLNERLRAKMAGSGSTTDTASGGGSSTIISQTTAFSFVTSRAESSASIAPGMTFESNERI